MLSQTKVEELNARFATKFAMGAVVERKSSKWNCKLSEMLVGNYLIIPITSAKMLKSEGYSMDNCCREYKRQCAKLEYCVFSIRSRSGERLATLGLKYDEYLWRFDQCFGPSNSEVLEETLEFLDEDGVLQTEGYATDIYYVAHEVVRLMNSTTGSH